MQIASPLLLHRNILVTGALPVTDVPSSSDKSPGTISAISTVQLKYPNENLIFVAPLLVAPKLGTHFGDCPFKSSGLGYLEAPGLGVNWKFALNCSAEEAAELRQECSVRDIL